MAWFARLPTSRVWSCRLHLCIPVPASVAPPGWDAVPDDASDDGDRRLPVAVVVEDQRPESLTEGQQALVGLLDDLEVACSIQGVCVVPDEVVIQFDSITIP